MRGMNMDAKVRARTLPGFAEAFGDKEVSFKSATITPDVDRSTRLVSGIVSTTAVDMDREVVIPSGMDFTYFPGAVKSVYLNHDYDSLPVGTCRRMVLKSGERLWAQTFITNRSIGDELLTAIEEGALTGFSVGFVPLEYGPPSDEERKRYGDCDRVIRQSAMIEYSLTAMPANHEALAELVSKSLIRRPTAVRLGLPDSPQRKVWRVCPAGRRVRLHADGSVSVA